MSQIMFQLGDLSFIGRDAPIGLSARLSCNALIISGSSMRPLEDHERLRSLAMSLVCLRHKSG